MRFDVLVLGGGTAGCVLAGRLSEDPDRSICLVEAGPDYGPYADGRWPEDMLDARRLAFSHAWETDREDRSQLRARILGGCSAHNACAVLEGTSADYDWGYGWSYETLRPHLDRARGELRTRQFSSAELTPWHRAFVEAAPDAVSYPVNAVATVRWNAAFAYVDPARARPNLTILAETLVERVRVDGARATAVSTTAEELEADTVVLTAGAYGSPGILLRSGIGPERGLPVGEGLSDHVGVGFGFEPTEAFRDEIRRFEQEHPVAMGQVTVPLQHGELLVFPGVDPGEDGYEISAAVFAMKPHSRGSVRLRSDDPRDPLGVEHGFLADERDAETLADAVDALRTLTATEPIRHYAAREIRPGRDVDAATYVRTAARGFFHPTGTCALGRVVDADARVLGFENLYVADASFVPSIPRVPVNLTVAAVAEKIAASLASVPN